MKGLQARGRGGLSHPRAGAAEPEAPNEGDAPGPASSLSPRASRGERVGVRGYALAAPGRSYTSVRAATPLTPDPSPPALRGRGDNLRGRRRRRFALRAPSGRGPGTKHPTSAGCSDPCRPGPARRIGLHQQLLQKNFGPTCLGGVAATIMRSLPSLRSGQGGTIVTRSVKKSPPPE